MSHTDKMRDLLNKIDRRILNEGIEHRPADLSKIPTDKLRELVSLHRHYGERDWSSFESAKRGALELYKREGQIISLVSPDGEEWTAESELNEGYRILPPLDPGYEEREGLEGPINANGRPLYYDPKEGKYYDPRTDMYLDHDEALDALSEGQLDEISDELATRVGDARHAAVKSADRSDRDAMMGKFDKFSKNQRLQHSRDIRQQKAGIKGQDPRSAEYQNAEPGRKNFGDSAECHDEMLDELSPKTLGKYVRGASRDAVGLSNMQGELEPNSFANDPKTEYLRNKAKFFGDKAKKRQHGIDRATDRLALGYPGKHDDWTKPNYDESLNELNKDTLGSYIKKSASELPRHSQNWLGKALGPLDRAHDRKHPQTGESPIEWDQRKVKNRGAGINRATDRLMREDATDNIETMQNIVADHQATKVKFADGTSMMVDVQTADVILKVYEAVNPDNQAKLNRMVNKDRASFMRVVDFCWSKVGFQEDTLTNEHDQVMAEIQDAMNDRGSEC